ncbi:polysaccharide lyase 6 family protein [Mucilaginibacter sp. HMF5004]|uniref:polysaccharide lyase 6 family protein n=1 Tax=Mucilaginibacter rivuli TaxID=2857527 RepID=UPI001C5F0611|nr:polysaccharide lyase 6 family protein [Mucilaginibacter rivuli]MBW4889224.1 polysaccharide lyase 6 family protein [Mucilaginibacter rivuli]
MKIIFPVSAKRQSIILLLILGLCKTAFAGDIKVNSIDALQRAINNAKPGDVIVLANGKYTAIQDITVDRKGTPKQPIVICAESNGNAEISGNGGFDLVSGAAYVTIKGFKFTNKAKKDKTEGGSHFCRWTQNIFENSGDGEDLTIAGSDHEIDHNTFQNKNAMGRMLAIRGTGKQIAERLSIHHNYFKNYTDQGGKNGAETLQFGLSGFSLSTSNSVVEYNLFEQCAGENELISVKASGVTLRYNTVRDCLAQFTLRHGNKCAVYGNYFINTPGLRIFGDDHIIVGNYFENCKPAITIGNGDGEVADGAQLTAHDRPDRILIANNTLVNNQQNYVMTQRTNGMGATDVTFTNNIIQGGGLAAAITGPYPGAKWQGNILFNVKDAGQIPTEGYTMADPKLTKGKNGYFAPGVAKEKWYYPFVKADSKGQVTAGTEATPVLKPENVGYTALN